MASYFENIADEEEEQEEKKDSVKKVIQDIDKKLVLLKIALEKSVKIEESNYKTFFFTSIRRPKVYRDKINALEEVKRILQSGTQLQAVFVDDLEEQYPSLNAGFNINSEVRLLIRRAEVLTQDWGEPFYRPEGNRFIHNGDL